MKKLTFFIVVLFLHNLCFTQNNSTTNLELFKTNYNNSNYSVIYKSLTDDFKKQVTEEQLNSFFKTNKFTYGKIISFEQNDTTQKKYLTIAEKGKFNLLFITINNEIAGFQITPFKEKVEANTVEELINKIGTKYISNKGNVGLMIGLSRNGIKTYYAFGETLKGNKTLPDSSSIFEIGSITKTFTGSLLADAVLQNKIKLNDVVSKYVPANIITSKNEKAATLVQLANHTAGFYRLTPDFFDYGNIEETNPYKYIDRKYFYKVLAQNELEFEPGLKNSYSNIGVALLGCILEDVNKKTYSQLLSDKIFTPLKMNSSFLKVPQNYLAKNVQGYAANGVATSHWDFDCIAPAGGIKSSASDMLTYLNAQLNTKNSNLNAMFNLAHKITYKQNESLSIALNWHCFKLNNKPVYWHNGGTGGFASFGAFEQNKNISIIVLLNNATLGEPDNIGIDILNYLLK